MYRIGTRRARMLELQLFRAAERSLLLARDIRYGKAEPRNALAIFPGNHICHESGPLPAAE